MVRKTLPVIFIISLTCIIYLPTLKGGFLLDDYPNIVNSSGIKIPITDFESFYSMAKSGVSSRIGRPFSVLSFGLNYNFSGLDPLCFRLTNLAIHIVNSILLFLLASTLVNNYIGLKKDSFSECIPFVLAVVWAVHPINVSSVAYIVQRMNLLSAFFVLLGIYSYVIARLNINNRTIGQSLAILAMFVFMGLGILSKENAVLLPLFILLVEKLLIPQSDSKADISLIIFVLIPVLCVSLFIIIDPGVIVKGYHFRDFTVIQRLLVQAQVMADYLQDIFFPVYSRLTFFKDYYLLPEGLFVPPTTAIFVFGILFFFLYCLVMVKRKPLVSFCGLFFFAAHVLESTVIPLELAFDHRNYLPSIGMMLLLCLVLRFMVLNWAISKNVVVLLLVCFYATQTFLYCTEWSNPLLHAKAEVEKSPRSFRANMKLGKEYFELYFNSKEEKFRVNSINNFVNAIHTNDNDPAPYVYVIKLNIMGGNAAPEIYLNKINQSLSYYPPQRSNPQRVNKLIELADKHPTLLPVDHVREAVEILERNLLPRNPKYLSEVLSVKAIFLWKIKKDRLGAIKYAERAVNASPDNGEYYKNLLHLLELANDEERAEALIRKISILFPENDI